MAVAKAAADMARDGFAVVKGLVDPEQLAQLSSSLTSLLAAQDNVADDTLRLYESGCPPSPDAVKYLTFKTFNHLPAAPAFDALRNFPLTSRIGQLARACMACGQDEALEYATKYLDKPPVPDRANRSVTPHHQDAWYFSQAAMGSGSGEEAAAAAVAHARLCSLWLALDNVDEENSCLRYLRGSHRPRRLVPHTGGGPVGFSQQAQPLPLAEVAADEVAVCLRAGDAVLHDGFVLHYAEANRSADRHRRALGIVYRRRAPARERAGHSKPGRL
eukprot:COSAG05_NODE_1779_length_4104_cov_5.080020_3_plen_274_part_00